MQRSGKLLVLNLLTGQKSGFSSAGATRCTDSRQTGCGQRTPGSASLCKFSPQSAQGCGNPAPKMSKISLFGKRVASQGRTPSPISIFLWLLYAQLSYISVSYLTSFASQVTELLLRNRTSVIWAEFFRAPCKNKKLI